MQAKHISQAVLICVVCALAGAFWLRTESQKGTEPGLPKDSKGISASTAASAPVSPAAAAQIQSFEQRLKEAPGDDWKNTSARARRAAILIEWLAADRQAAMQFLARNHFRDLWLPAVAKAIGETATPSELLGIANGADSPGEAVYQVARWDTPGAINELASLMPSVNVNAAGPTAGAIGSLLAGINVDRAMAFAMGQATDQMRSFAISGVMDELSLKPSGDAEVRTWYTSLPPSIQNSDQVAAAYSDAIWALDPDAALQTLAGISSPQTRMIAALVLANRSASTSPETAIAAIYQSGMPDIGIYNHVNQILQSWSAVDPQAAAAFLSTTQIIPSADLYKYAPIVVPPNGGKG
jgi:hypothetical protein